LLLPLLLQLLEIAPLELTYASGGNLLYALLKLHSPEVLHHGCSILVVAKYDQLFFFLLSSEFPAVQLLHCMLTCCLYRLQCVAYHADLCNAVLVLPLMFTCVHAGPAPPAVCAAAGEAAGAQQAPHCAGHTAQRLAADTPGHGACRSKIAVSALLALLSMVSPCMLFLGSCAEGRGTQFGQVTCSCQGTAQSEG
jgi:hypothetical protein